MIRYVAVLRRLPGTGVDDFLTAWLGEHRGLALGLPLVRRVEFLPAVTTGDTPQPYDGIGFLDFDSTDDLQTALASEQAKALRAHTPTFADGTSVVRLVVEVP